MATMPMTPPEVAAPMMAPAEEAAAPMPAGYVIEIMVHDDGTFSVSKKEDMGEETAEPAGESFDSLGAALKAVMSMVNENPIGASEQGQFDAGFAAKY